MFTSRSFACLLGLLGLAVIVGCSEQRAGPRDPMWYRAPARQKAKPITFRVDRGGRTAETGVRGTPSEAGEGDSLGGADVGRYGRSTSVSTGRPPVRESDAEISYRPAGRSNDGGIDVGTGGRTVLVGEGGEGGARVSQDPHTPQ